VAGALYAYDGIRRTRLPMDDAPAAAALIPKSRRKSERWGRKLRSYGGEIPADHPALKENVVDRPVSVNELYRQRTGR
jgi:hypothetical protein